MAEAARELTRRERRKLEVRTRIVEAAAELFDADGVHDTTVAAIAERADVASKTFFNYFPAKQDVVRALAEESLEDLLESIEAAHRGQSTTAARLKTFFDDVATYGVDAGPMHRELLTEIIHAAQRAGEEESARRLHDAFASIVRDGVAAGEVTRRHTQRTLTEMIVGAYYALMFNAANIENYPLERQARAAADFLVAAIAPDPNEEN